MTYNPLTPEEHAVIVEKSTEQPFRGKYDQTFIEGTYLCRRCNTPLFPSQAKFDAGCGWPSFDAHFPSAVTRIPDDDGIRTEIVCSHCNAHLGHVFLGEQMTPENTRHCANSLSLFFVPKGSALPEVLDA